MKSPAVAFFLSLIPGLGHLYINRYIRTFFYLGGSAFIFLATFIATVGLNGGDEAAFIGFILFGLIWGINMLDMVITISNKHNGVFQPKPEYQNVNGQMVLVSNQTVADPLEEAQKEERLKILFISLIPGAAHIFMGYHKRGFSALISFFAVLILPFIMPNIIYSSLVWYVLLLAPVILIYSIIDARQVIKAKQNDIAVEDSYIYDGLITSMLKEPRNDLALLFSLVPGLGHLAIGYAKQGFLLLLIMTSSFLLINEFNMFYLRYFTLLLWVYSFFDILYILRNQRSKQQGDETLLEAIKSYKNWIGLGLIIIGLYFIVDVSINHFLGRINEQWYLFYHQYKHTFLSIVAAFIVILSGVKLMTGSIANRANKKEIKSSKK